MTTALEQIEGFLPRELGRALRGLPGEVRDGAEELRLRTGRIPTILTGRGEQPIPGLAAVKPDDLYAVLELASQYSAHTVLDRVKNGFLTLPGGHRMGLCGTARVERGEVEGFQTLSSLNIRIARERKGLARAIAPRLMGEDGLESTLLLAPPGVGKTTLLRDLIRCLSDGDGVPAMRVSVADERGELAAAWEGTAQMDLGRQTDWLDGAPKAEGLLLLLRGMGPQILAADEITRTEDVEAICQAAGCGVSLLATAHAKDVKGMTLRPVYRELLRKNIFRRAVVICRDEDGKRIMKVEEIPCCDW